MATVTETGKDESILVAHFRVTDFFKIKLFENALYVDV